MRGVWKNFPDETWEYYYEKIRVYGIPSHLNIDVEFNERKPNPNELFELYRIDKDNNTGQNLNDLSQEVPEVQHYMHIRETEQNVKQV